jgi:fucose permease
MTQQNAVSTNKLKYLLYFGFLLSGISTVLIGQVLPVFSLKFKLNDLQLGYFFPTQFSGSLLGTFAVNFLSRRYGFVLPSVIGCISMACGVFLMSFDSFYLCLGGLFLNGFGIGLTLPSINMLIIEMNPIASIEYFPSDDNFICVVVRNCLGDWFFGQYVEKRNA